MLLEAQTPAGYQWIDQNTPKDSRVMAWWDYGPSHEASMKGADGKTHGWSRGYQITGIARRTSIADGPCPRRLSSEKPSSETPMAEATPGTTSTSLPWVSSPKRRELFRKSVDEFAAGGAGRTLTSSEKKAKDRPTPTFQRLARHLSCELTLSLRGPQFHPASGRLRPRQGPDEGFQHGMEGHIASSSCRIRCGPEVVATTWRSRRTWRGPISV